MKFVLKQKYIIKFLRALVLLALLAFMAGCDKGHGKQSQAPRPAPEVGIIVLEQTSVILTTQLPGRTSAFRIAEIRPQVNGILLKRHFQEGSNVEAGQLLYQIDPAPFEAALASARASLAKAEANLPSVKSKALRYERLLAENAISRQNYDDAASAYAQAEAEISFWKSEVKKAGINLDYTRVNAPIPGRIGRSRITEGALVTAYQSVPLATIQQLDPIYVDVVQSSSEFLRLRRSLEKGLISKNPESQSKVKIFLEDGSQYPVEGALKFRDVTVDPTTGSFVLRVVVPNPDNLLLPGMFVRAAVEEGVVKQAILAPQQAVGRNTKGDPIAFVVDDQGRVSQKMLTIDRAVGNQWLVSSGLQSGDRLIVEGTLNIRPGVTVKTVKVQVPRTGA